MDDMGSVSDSDLEERVCSLAGRIAAATCEWLLLVGELDRRQLWAGVGVRSAAQWLSWRCGLSPRAAQDHVRVAHALTVLPLTRAEFAAGRLSFSKVRAITRVATAQDEAALVDLARCATAAQVERTVAGWRRVTPEEAHSRYARRRVAFRVRDDGLERCLIDLAPEEMALLRAAVERQQAVMVTPLADSSTHGDGTDGDGTAGDPEGELAGCAMPQPTAQGSAADALVAILTGWLAATPLPDSGLGAGIGEVVVTIDAATLARASAPRDASHAPESVPRNADIPTVVDPLAVPGLVPAPGGHRPDVRRRSPGGVSRVDGGQSIAPQTVVRLLCQAATVGLLLDKAGNPLDIGRRSRRISRSMRRALRLRDEGRCQAPGCTRRDHLEAHHIRPWSAGGPTRIDNLLLLCSFHHELVHEGGWAIATPARGVFLFLDPTGTSVPGGHPLPTATSPLQHTVDPEPFTATDGSRMDLDFVLWVLLNNRDTARLKATAQGETARQAA